MTGLFLGKNIPRYTRPPPSSKGRPMQPRRLPAIDKLLNAPALRPLLAQHGVGAVKEGLRALQDQVRRDGSAPGWAAQPAEYARRLAEGLAGHGYRPMHNMTGTLIHTNLGRAPLSQALWAAVQPLVTGALNLEYDLVAGRRGRRDSLVAERLVRLTGAEDATVVNNNAGALLLVLNTLAEGRPVPVSRGELIEIGGSFRLPDLMRRSGCRLHEVGTTNRTHLSDFAAVADAALLLKVHPSNYAIAGFTSAVGTGELAELAQRRGLPLCVDVGSGALVDLTRFGLPEEPLPGRVLAQGADLVTFSGDKLMGGPQAGLIVGRADLIAQLRANPLMRALRPDKVTLTLLDAVLKLYEEPDRLTQALPVLRMLTTPVKTLEQRAEALRQVLSDQLPGWRLEAKASAAQIGSGALPTQRLDSRALVLSHADAKAPTSLSQRLRRLEQPVLGRVRQGALWLDLRSVVDFDGALASLRELDPQ